ncbi:metallophosphoesterase [Methanosphaera cuniculi]|uniref:Phosphoesterase n=1 Tax=Methanosphaera cuniculi TaxID=1077256 RepID=A0A2A2HDJ1_9EURY|nr:metallophosphoesterase [Methanosphaera cuniculi]PAV07499.1 metallophosphatase [Methanosphaera cuniculi]PWL07656.1 hypothetical protein MSCUN_14070 [Methanosphaera cuniculi]
MKIGVISDTHIPARSYSIPEKVFELFDGVELILHAGDIEDLSVVEKLEEIAPVIAVCGNCDNHPTLNTSEVIEVDGIKIGLIHGVVYPRGDTQQLYYLAKQLGVDVLISGHTHQPMIQQIKDVLLLNPGSPTQPRLTDPTVMLLEINDGKIEADIIKIGKPVCRILDVSQFKKQEN